MESHDDLRGAEASPGGAVAAQIAALQLQVAELTQRLQLAVKTEVVSDADKQSVKTALEGLDGGDLFNEAVAVQYSQAKMQRFSVNCAHFFYSDRVFLIIGICAVS